MAKVFRKRSAPKGGLGQLDVEQFMALTSSDEDEKEKGKKVRSRKRKRQSKPQKLPATSRKRRSSEQEQEEQIESEFLRLTREIESQMTSSEDEEDVGVIEPRPPEVTSWKQKVGTSEDSSDGASDASGSEGEGEQEEEQLKGEEVSGKNVTLRMVRQWVKTLEKSHSLHSLRLLSGALHAAILTNLHHQQDTPTPYHFVVKDSTVFNAVVVSCFQHIPLCLQHHFPHTASSSVTPPTKLCLPSSQDAWSKVRRTLKQYLSDLLSLADSLQDADMQHAVLKQIHTMAPYFASLPKLLKPLNKCLVEKWSTSESRVQVLAFLALRKVVLFQSHPALHTLLKKAYMAFVRNCKFSSASTLPGIKFMTSSLVELLAVDPPTCYHHGFVYIRQLAVHLRTALTSGKKDAQQAVYNWQFVHCLNLWTQVLSQVNHASLRPLIYPLVQIILGTLSVQPTAKYYPLRLHLVRLLLQLANTTNTFIPIATYLVEVIETHGVEVGGARLQSGKPPDLHTLLRATKQQLNTRSFRTAVVNEAFLLMLQYFCEHTHYIGFPELVYPPVARLRKVSKATPYSWLRLQLKQMIEKVEELSKDIVRERASVTFSPVQHDLVTSWENQHKGKETSLSRFWMKFKQLQSKEDHVTRQSMGAATTEGEEGSVEEEEEGSQDVSSDEEDVVEDLQLDD